MSSLSRAVVLPALLGGEPRLQLGDLTSKDRDLVAFVDQVTQHDHPRIAQMG